MSSSYAGGQSDTRLIANKGEFSIKDSDYGDIVLAELAKIL